MKDLKLHNLNTRGFTIIELMIATTVLSVVLLLATSLMTNIGNLFQKGVNQSRVQDAARSIADDVSQNLKLNIGTLTSGTGSGPTAGFDAYCIGDTRYSYVIDQKIGTTGQNDPVPGGTPEEDHVLWRDSWNPLNPCVPADLSQPSPSSAGTELISPNSRLTAFCIGQLSGGSCSIASGSPYTISIEVAYGDGDLLNGTTGLNVTCNGHTGDQFCATSSLTTVAVNRKHP